MKADEIRKIQCSTSLEIGVQKILIELTAQIAELNEFLRSTAEEVRAAYVSTMLR